MVEIFPSIFIGLGSPAVILEKKGKYNTTLNQLFSFIKKTKNIIIISAHWETKDYIEITANPNPEILYDFYGFPTDFIK